MLPQEMLSLIACTLPMADKALLIPLLFVVIAIAAIVMPLPDHTHHTQGTILAWCSGGHTVPEIKPRIHTCKAFKALGALSLSRPLTLPLLQTQLYTFLLQPHRFLNSLNTPSFCLPTSPASNLSPIS